jgi:hypothetical protein
MKVAYADPPYLGCAKKYYEKGRPGQAGHARAKDYDDPETHVQLVKSLIKEFPDGWALSCNTRMLKLIFPYLPEKIRVGAWVKAYGPFKKNVNPAYLWEPVIFCGGRPRLNKKPYIYDWHVAQVCSGPFFMGRKPESFSFWVFEMLGMEPVDQLIDLFPGSGAVSRAWESYCRQYKMFWRVF